MQNNHPTYKTNSKLMAQQRDNFQILALLCIKFLIWNFQLSGFWFLTIDNMNTLVGKERKRTENKLTKTKIVFKSHGQAKYLEVYLWWEGRGEGKVNTIDLGRVYLYILANSLKSLSSCIKSVRHYTMIIRYPNAAAIP